MIDDRSPRPDEVQKHFERPDRYLSTTGLALRASIIAELAGPSKGSRDVLDAGCGDGSLSRPFLLAGDRVTFVDFSSEMLRRAESATPEPARARARFRQASIVELGYDAEFDVVMGIGVLAHVPSLVDALGELARAARPGARVIVQYTDHDRLSAMPYAAWRRLRERVRPTYGYSVRETSGQAIDTALRAAGLRKEAERRYWLVPPLLRNVLPKRTRDYFEEVSATQPTLAKTGFEVVAAYRKPERADRSS